VDESSLTRELRGGPGIGVRCAKRGESRNKRELSNRQGKRGRREYSVTLRGGRVKAPNSGKARHGGRKDGDKNPDFYEVKEEVQ